MFDRPFSPSSLLSFGLVFAVGGLMIVAIPPFAVHDELFHWHRVVQMASGGLFAQHLGPNAWGGAIDKRAYDYSLWFLAKFQAQSPINVADAWHLARDLGTLPPERQVVSFPSTASFSPLAHLPQAFGVALARLCEANLLVQVFAGRAFNLLAYLALVATILRVLPAGQGIFIAIAFIPTALHLASSLSADPMNFVLPALLVAWSWRLRSDLTALFGRKERALFGALVIALALLKPMYLLFGGVTVLVPMERFGSAREKWLFLGGCLAAALLVGAAWNATYPFVPGKYWQTGADPKAAIKTILDNPRHAIWVFYSTVRDWHVMWWFDGYGRFGGHPPPYSLYVSSTLSWTGLYLLVALGVVEGGDRRDFPLAGVFVGVAGAFAVFLLVAFWIGFTRPGSPRIDGIQGRYFYLVHALSAWTLVALAPVRSRFRIMRHPVFCAALITHGATLLAAIVHFHRYWSL